MKLRKLGFCGVDDSVSPRMLGLICQSYPFVEFGVLFRPDKEGQPRYASKEWVKELSKVVQSSNHKMQLAAHLCEKRVLDILEYKSTNGDNNTNPAKEFLDDIQSNGFYRVQINATKVNGVDPSKVTPDSIQNICHAIKDYPNLEFIIQKNEETKPLWEGILNSTLFDIDEEKLPRKLPTNVVMLVDESKGTGLLASSWPIPPMEYDIGYAGGIGPMNVKQVLKDIMDVASGRDIWIDMESSLRTKISKKVSIHQGEGGEVEEVEQDVFDLGKCFKCIEVVCELGLYKHPQFLTSVEI